MVCSCRDTGSNCCSGERFSGSLRCPNACGMGAEVDVDKPLVLS